MDRKRSIAYGTIILGLALGSSQWFRGQEPQKHIVLPAPEGLAAAPAPTVSPPIRTEPAAPERPVAVAMQADSPAQVTPRQISAVETVAAVIEDTAATPSPAADAACAPVLDLIAEPDAMIGVTLLAPCQSNARVVLSHGGLSVTARATATGSVFTSLPALDAAGEVTVLLADGTRHSAALPMPEAAGLRRFAVQWQADDTLSLHAFAEDATYGDAGHVTVVRLADLPAGDSVTGKIVELGDASVALPLLAQVYTYSDGAPSALTVEAQVTAATCGRDLLGETLGTTAGRVERNDLILPMPDCNALGEFLVLNIPAPDLTLAAAD